eukprot:7792943-Alexandrium_andersonii.AAC.1
MAATRNTHRRPKTTGEHTLFRPRLEVDWTSPSVKDLLLTRDLYCISGRWRCRAKRGTSGARQ